MFVCCCIFLVLFFTTAAKDRLKAVYKKAVPYRAASCYGKSLPIFAIFHFFRLFKMLGLLVFANIYPHYLRSLYDIIQIHRVPRMGIKFCQQ